MSDGEVLEDVAKLTWERLIAADKITDVLEPDEKTAQMYADETGKSYSRAATLLARYYREGKLTRRKMRGHGWAYKVAEKKG